MPDGARRFVIYAQGRTGSHLLMNLLTSHPELECAGEVLNRERWPGLWSTARRAALRLPEIYLPWRARAASHRVWGCKVPIATAATGLARLQAAGWCMLFLQRRSVFDRALSWCVASLTGQFQRPADDRREPLAMPVTVPETMFRRQLAFRTAWDERSQRVMAAIPHVPLFFEDHLADPARWRATSTILQQHLGLPACDVSVTSRRAFDRSYAEVVTNHDLLRHIADEYANAYAYAPVADRSASTGSGSRA